MEELKIQIHSRYLKELHVGDKTFRSPYDFHLSEADLEKSRKELGETEEVKNTSLQKLRKLLSGDQDIRFRTDDPYLLRYLRHQKFDFRKAYKIIRNFYLTRNQYPYLYQSPSNEELFRNSKIVNLLPYTDEDGTMIFIIKFRDWKFDEVTLCDVLRLSNIFSDVATMNPHAQINGFSYIWDFTEANISAFISSVIHPRMLRIWPRIIQDLCPWKIKRVIFFNCTKILYTTFLGVRYLLKKKTADRVVPLRSDLSELHRYVNPVILPKEYGGKLDDIDCHSYFIQPILDNEQYLKYEHSFINIDKA